ncbi:MAG: peptidase [Thaumarchaeota archaeon]|nr:peptidase [Nitrososphaerota archaeon]
MKVATTFFIICLIIFPITKTYGHGLGLETISLNVEDRKISVTTQIIPTEFSESAQKQIIMTVTDSLTTQNVDAILLVALYHEGGQIFRESFATKNGILRINVNPTQDLEIKISGTDPIQISGPILNSGGLYRFDVDIKSLDSNELQNQAFSTYITSITNHYYDEQGKDGTPVEFRVKSYYDGVSGFDYSPETNSIMLEMPFEWSERNISHTEVVHEEIHFPKEFADFMVPSYSGTVNGIDLFKSSVTIDDYSIEDERVVHFVLTQDTIRYLKQAQKSAGIENPLGMKFELKVGDKIVFPVIAMTKDESLQVDMSWEPDTIEPSKNTKFIYTFRDGKTGELLRNTSYDFVILQNGKELYKKSANAQIGGDYADYTFTESQKGQTTIQFNNLRGTGQGTEFTIMVVPEFGPLVILVLGSAFAAVMMFRRSVLFQ